MKLEIDAEILAEGLKTNVAEAGTMPVLQHALLVAEGETLRITTSDMSQWLTVTLPAKIIEPGTQCAKAALLSRAVQGLKGVIAVESTEANALVVKQGRRRFSIDGLPADAYPAQESLERFPVDTDPQALRAALDRVSYAAGKKDVRFYLNGVYIGESTVVATDGHRLACSIANVDIKKGVILPKFAAPKLSGFLDSDDAKLFLLGKNDNNPSAILVVRPSFEFRAQLIDATYPDVKKFSPPPKGSLNGCVFSAMEAKAALERLAPFSEREIEKIKHNQLALETKGNLLLIKPAFSEGSEDFVELETKPEKPMKSGMEMRYLADVLRVIGDAMVSWHQEEQNGKQYFTVEDKEEFHVVMPFRL